jgi:hypothetical protein
MAIAAFRGRCSAKGETMGNTDFDKDQEQQSGQKQSRSDHSGRQGHGQGGSEPPQENDGNQRSEVGHDKIGNS